MKLLKHIANWLLLLMVMPFVTFVLSLLFDFSYWDAMHHGGYRFLYGIVSIMLSVMYLIDSDDPNGGKLQMIKITNTDKKKIAEAYQRGYNMGYDDGWFHYKKTDGGKYSPEVHINTFNNLIKDDNV
jgi:hypothetical protein